MTGWPANPRIHEVNAWTWLDTLSRRHGRRVTLANVPDPALAEIAHGYDAVWLMGVWTRSPEGRLIALTEPGLQQAYHTALAEYTADDVAGSPYAVRAYRVDEVLGGPVGLATLRVRLRRHGVRLLLDFVPNHVARDHEWTRTHPEYLIQGSEDDLRREPEGFFVSGDRIYACGRDPHFPAWTDTAQLHAFSEALRAASRTSLLVIAEQCDGVRCDMAMLVTNDVFARTWGDRAGPRPPTEFWTGILPAVREAHPDFLFVAEVYWDLEWPLLQQGFDYCYDKRLYDRLRHGDGRSVRDHLLADLTYQARMLRFVENHDEGRARSVFGERWKAAALAGCTLPGATLVHDGQQAGRRRHVPVQLGRCPDEEPDAEVQRFYASWLDALPATLRHDARWRLWPVTGDERGAPDGVLAWVWWTDTAWRLVAVNYSGERVRAGLRRADGPDERIDLTVFQVLVALGPGSLIRPDGQAGVELVLDPWDGGIVGSGD